MITERQRKILDTIIREYIDSAQPVSSQSLSEKYDFGLCSATLRIEMKNLTDNGLLQKPHISSGRIPTDRAYRVFVDNLLEERIDDDDLGELFRQRLDYQDFVDNLADISSGYVLFFSPKKHILRQSGFENLVKEPEFTSHDFVLNFLSFIEEANRKQEEINIERSLEIFIGKENFLSKGEDLTMICANGFLDGQERFRLSLIGPKRMDYCRNLSILNSLIKNLK